MSLDVEWVYVRSGPKVRLRESLRVFMKTGAFTQMHSLFKLHPAEQKTSHSFKLPWASVAGALKAEDFLRASLPAEYCLLMSIHPLLRQFTSSIYWYREQRTSLMTLIRNIFWRAAQCQMLPMEGDEFIWHKCTSCSSLPYFFLLFSFLP